MSCVIRKLNFYIIAQLINNNDVLKVLPKNTLGNMVEYYKVALALVQSLIN